MHLTLRELPPKKSDEDWLSYLLFSS